MKKYTLFFLSFLFLNFCDLAQTVTDYDGNIYNTVTIGTQVWMKENLKAIHYANGDAIPNVTNNTSWNTLGTGAFCYYNNTADTDSINKYGSLYNWHTTVDARNLCPTDWHVPSDSEWTTLTDYLGGALIAGGKLKEVGTLNWQSPNTGATNETDFTAIPSGGRSSVGDYYDIGSYCYWWSSTEFSIGAPAAFQRNVSYNGNGVGGGASSKENGNSVRCLQDADAKIPLINLKDEIKIYPNPANNQVFINYYGKQNYQIQIIDIVGNSVYKQNTIYTTNSIDISSFSPGIYTVLITCDEFRYTQKIIKK